MTIRLKDRRKPWQKACIDHKFALCGSILSEDTKKFRYSFNGTIREYLTTIGDLERSGIEPDTPLRYRPSSKT